MWENTYGYTRKEPIGVCGMITPWNFPALMTAWKIGPMLAAGCTGISKPPELAPLSSLKLVELWNKTPGVIPGVLNCLPGIGSETGEMLVDHPDIRKIAFTGSGERGKRIMQRATSNLKRVTLELGGKGPLLVFDDADIEKAANISAFMGYLNSGQFCAAPTRLIVQDGVYDEFVDKMIQKT
jgi:acyl-CoA reductase-like NAD-dependent aldehyde dehydrogenase